MYNSKKPNIHSTCRIINYFDFILLSMMYGGIIILILYINKNK